MSPLLARNARHPHEDLEGLDLRHLAAHCPRDHQTAASAGSSTPSSCSNQGAVAWRWSNSRVLSQARFSSSAVRPGADSALCSCWIAVGRSWGRSSCVHGATSGRPHDIRLFRIGGAYAGRAEMFHAEQEPCQLLDVGCRSENRSRQISRCARCWCNGPRCPKGLRARRASASPGTNRRPAPAEQTCRRHR